MQVGISGHQRLRDPNTWEWVRQKMRDHLAAVPPPLVGISSLAIGADTIFAEIVLELGGSLEVILPFYDYQRTFIEAPARLEYQKLLHQTSQVEVLQKSGPDEDAYYAAGKRVVDRSALLILVWDGKPAGGLGGTADIAEYAHQSQKQIIHLNPETHTVTKDSQSQS
jgi:hypothetical protein